MPDAERAYYNVMLAVDHWKERARLAGRTVDFDETLDVIPVVKVPRRRGLLWLKDLCSPRDYCPCEYHTVRRLETSFRARSAKK